MANSLNTNPIYLDTFTSDVTVVLGVSRYMPFTLRLMPTTIF